MDHKVSKCIRDLTLIYSYYIIVIFLENLKQIRSLEVYLDDIVSSKIILVMRNTSINQTDVFTECWSINLLNVVLVIEKTIEFFTFSPFIDSPNIVIQKLSSPYDAPSQNYHGHEISVGGSTLIIAEILFKDFLHEEINYMKNRFNLTQNYLPNDDSVEHNESFPRKSTSYFEYEDFKAIVPRTLIDKSMYFLLPFNPNVWLTICFYIVFGSVILTIVDRVLTKDHDFIGNFMESLRLTLSQVTALKLKSPIASFIYMIMIVNGFVLATLYCLYLGTFLITDIRSNDFEIAISIGDDYFASDIQIDNI